ncbi:MAG: transposase, partial [Mangrovibacterium sp.]
HQFFMLGITYKGLAFPLMFSLLSKQGNSNTSERIQLLQRFISLFGKECIDCLVADREFVGNKWIEFLNKEEIRYYIRIRNNFKVFLPRENREVKAFWLFNHLKNNEYYTYPHVVRLGNQLCYLSGEKIIEKGKGKSFLIVISVHEPQDPQEQYAKRWQIQTSFKAMKTSGCNIEKTHLNQVNRIEK